MRKFNYKNLKEGIQYTNGNYIFDFSKDDLNDIVYLDCELFKSYFDEYVYRYGYELNDSGLRNDFINWLKTLPDDYYQTEDITHFINNALNKFHREFNITSFDCIIYPDSSHNKLVQRMLYLLGKYIPDGSVLQTYELTKNIQESQLLEVEDKIEEDFNNLKTQDYFSIARSGIPFSKREYVRDYLTLDNENAINHLQNLNNGNSILVVDDINTTGSTLEEVLRAISKINSQCEIVIFTLIGK